jgi:hypothetical protein
MWSLAGVSPSQPLGDHNSKDSTPRSTPLSSILLSSPRLDSLERTPFLLLQVSYDLFWPSLLRQAPLTKPPHPFAYARIRRQEVTITELVI